MVKKDSAEPRYNKIRSQKRVEVEDLNTTHKNKEAIRDFTTAYLSGRGVKPVTISRYYYSLGKFLDYFDSKLDFDKAKREDIMRAMGKVNSSGLASETKRKISISIKVFYKFLLGNGETYPVQVSWIKTNVSKEKKILPSDLLSYEECLKIIEKGRSVRDKAILALLTEWGLRVSELTSMKVKSVQLNENQITVRGKTGQRTIPLVMSKPYLIAHMENMKAAEPEAPLWQSEGTWKYKAVPITNAAVNKMLKIAAKDAGIKKSRIYVHLLRHSSATRNATIYSTDVMNMLYGWTPSSSMHATYVTLNAGSVKKAVFEANGITDKKEIIKPTKECGMCGEANPNTYSFCCKCGYDLSKPPTTYKKDKDNIKELITESLKDPKLLEEVIHNYLMEEHKRKQR